MTDEERDELAEIVKDKQARDARMAADPRAQMWDDGPARPEPPAPVGRIVGPGEHGDILIDCAKTYDELVEEHYERDPVTGQYRRSTWTEA